MKGPSFSRTCDAGHKAVQIFAAVVGFAIIAALILTSACQGAVC